MNLFKVTVIDPTQNVYSNKEFYKKQEALDFLKSKATNRSYGQINKETSHKAKLTLGFLAYHSGRITTDNTTDYYIGLKKSVMKKLKKI